MLCNKIIYHIKKMKSNYIFSLLLIIFLFNINLCQDNDTDNSLEKKEVSNKLLDYLTSLTKLKEITKPELQEIFLNIYDLLLENSGKEKNETMIKEDIPRLTEKVFENFSDKEKDAIIVEDLMKNFDPTKLKEFIYNFFHELDLKQFFQSFMIELIKIATNFFMSLFTNTDL